jgi:hypothetical protein
MRYLLILLIVIFLATAQAQDKPVDFVSRTVDKTIIVTPRQTFTVPGNKNQGTRIIVIKENIREDEKEKKVIDK